MTLRPLKSVLLTTLTLASFVGCGGEMQEPLADEALSPATAQQALAGDDRRPGACKDGQSFTSNGSQYRFCPEAVTWKEARAQCQSLGSGFDLVTINDSVEEAFLAQEQKNRPLSLWWLGYTDQEREGEFASVADASRVYVNWSPGEPNDSIRADDPAEDCAVDNWDSKGRWNDYPCDLAQPFICESNRQNLTAKNSAPVVSAGLDATGSASSELSLSGSARDAEGDAFQLQWTFTRGAGVDSRARCTFGSPHAASTSLSCDTDGVYTVTLTADDGVNPPVSSEARVMLSSASKVTACNQPLYTNNPTLRLCGWATPGKDGSPITSVWYTVDGGPRIALRPEPSGGFVSTFHTVDEGPHTVRMYALNALNQETMRQKQVSVDVTPPRLTVLPPTAQDANQRSAISVVSEASDASPVKVTTMRLLSSRLERGSGSVTHTLDLGNTGWTTVLVQAQDAAGNVSEVRTRVDVRP